MALLRTNEELQLYLGNVANTLSIERLMPTIETVEEDVLVREYLGHAQYVALKTAYTNNTLDQPGNAHLKALLPYTQRLLAYMAVLDFMGELIVKIDGNGLSISKTERQEAARMWQVNKLEERYERAGYRAAEGLLNFLAENKASYTDWASSDAFEELTNCLISTAAEFNKHYPIGRSRLIFMRMKPAMIDCQLKFIRPVISEAYLDELIEKLRDDDLEPADEKALVLMRKALANYTVAESLLSQVVQLGNMGVVVKAFLKTEYSNRNDSAPTDKQSQLLAERCTSNAQFYLSDLSKLLNGNPIDYPTFADSDAYTPDNAQGDLMPTQKPSNGFFRTH